MTQFPDIRFYWGAGSGSAAKTLRQLHESHVMLSYRSYPTLPWNIDDLFVDCGGYSLLKTGKTSYETPHTEYLSFVQEHDANLYALRDFPCEPDLRADNGTTVAEHQRKTIEAHQRLLTLHDRWNVEASPVAVIQGWEPDEYLFCLDAMDRHGILDRVEHVGIGSICRRFASDAIHDVITTVADQLPDKKLHAFGVKKEMLDFQEIRDVLWSVDSSAWYIYPYNRKEHDDHETWHIYAEDYLDYKRRLWELW